MADIHISKVQLFLSDFTFVWTSPSFSLHATGGQTADVTASRMQICHVQAASGVQSCDCYALRNKKWEN